MSAAAAEQGRQGMLGTVMAAGTDSRAQTSFRFQKSTFVKYLSRLTLFCFVLHQTPGYIVAAVTHIKQRCS